MKTSINLESLTEEQLTEALAKKREEKKRINANRKKIFNEENDYFCKSTAEKFIEISNALKILKEETITEAYRLYNEMFLLNDKKPKEVKSFMRKNKEGNIMVVVDAHERIEFTEEATVHINTIKDIFKNKFSSRNKGLYNILDGLLIKGRKGEYDPKLLAKSRKQVKDLGDETLIKEFDKLTDCQRVVGTSRYCRVKVKDTNDKWQDINVQFSSL